DYLAYDLITRNKNLQALIQNNSLRINVENHVLLSPISFKRTDIEIFISGCGFVIECKNLKHVDPEYIKNGVTRFTEEFYSKSDSDAGMIGFVVSGDRDKIITGLKSLVGAHNPTANCQQLLNQLCINYPKSFHSEHKRKTKEPILVHHLFINLQ
ncbi:MAG: hypothetical protein Q8S01_10625, partial [Ignavibacteria bacterium]|nr:hypothetical protein [Ignavibacteria bacterium]